MAPIEVSVASMVEPHALLMVRETNKIYAMEVTLKMNQRFDVFDQG